MKNFIIGEKKQMTQIFAEDGTVVPVTIIDVKDVSVVAKKNDKKQGVKAIIIGKDKKKNFTKAEEGKFKEAGFVPKYVKETQVEEAELESIKIGDKINPSVFAKDEKVSVTGVTKSKGFQGVVKKWGFSGGPKTHGQSDRHRAPGSIGSGTTPGRVYKGKKMAGRMGGTTKTVKNLKVVLVDEENGLIALKGAVPGNVGSLVIISGN